MPYKVGMRRKRRDHDEEEPWSNEKVLREMERFYKDEFLNRIDKDVPKIVIDADKPYKEVLEQAMKVCCG